MHHFDRRYALASTRAQMLRASAKTVQGAGQVCKRPNVDGGETTPSTTQISTPACAALAQTNGRILCCTGTSSALFVDDVDGRPARIRGEPDAEIIHMSFLPHGARGGAKYTP